MVVDLPEQRIVRVGSFCLTLCKVVRNADLPPPLILRRLGWDDLVFHHGKKAAVSGKWGARVRCDFVAQSAGARVAVNRMRLPRHLVITEAALELVL